MSDAPQGLLDVAELVDQRIERLLVDEQRRWESIDERLAEAITELGRIIHGGKRLRAGFCYWAWLGAVGGRAVGDGPENSPIIDVCTSFELLQAFALIHDDIMDDADLRRGERTIHMEQAARLEREGWRGEARRYGDGVAILVGDLSHVYADQLIGNPSAQSREIWDRLRIELNLGQYLDMRSAAAGDLDKETASRVATFKSALYTIVRPLQLGATIAGPADRAVLDRLEGYGRPAGQAFQLRDDLLDVTADSTQVGKPVGNDLREGKPTELVAVAFERATAADREVLSLIGRPDLGADETAAIIATLEATGAVAEIEQRIDDLVSDAIRVAEDLPFATTVKEALIAFANYVAARDY